MIGDSNVLLIIGGYAGLVSAVIAAYLSAAIVINSSLRRAALPIFPAMPTR
jgi:succinate-acetate transporter protein